MNTNASTFNETLTVFAQGFMAQKENSIIDWVAPWVSVGVASGDYKLFDQNDPFGLYDTQLTEGSESQSVHFNASTETFNCRPNGLKISISDWERKQAGEKGAEVMRMGKLNTLLSTQLVNRERAGWAKIFAAVPAKAGKGIWVSAQTEDPIETLDACIEDINNATGSMPNAIALGLASWKALKNHPKVIARLQGIAASATLESVAGMLLNPGIEIRVGSMPYNEAKLGKKASKKGIIDANVLIFHRSDAPTTDDMSAFKTFTLDAPGVAEVQTHDDRMKHCTWDEVLWSEDVKVCAPIAVTRLSIS